MDSILAPFYITFRAPGRHLGSILEVFGTMLAPFWCQAGAMLSHSAALLRDGVLASGFWPELRLSNTCRAKPSLPQTQHARSDPPPFCGTACWIWDPYVFITLHFPYLRTPSSRIKGWSQNLLSYPSFNPKTATAQHRQATSGSYVPTSILCPYFLSPPARSASGPKGTQGGNPPKPERFDNSLGSCHLVAVVASSSPWSIYLSIYLSIYIYTVEMVVVDVSISFKVEMAIHMSSIPMYIYIYIYFLYIAKVAMSLPISSKVEVAIQIHVQLRSWVGVGGVSILLLWRWRWPYISLRLKTTWYGNTIW